MKAIVFSISSISPLHYKVTVSITHVKEYVERSNAFVINICQDEEIIDSENTHWRQLCPSIFDIEAESCIS